VTYRFKPTDFGPLVRAMLTQAELGDLGPGRESSEILPQLAELKSESLFDGRAIVDPQMANCCLSGLWLLFDFLDRSHTISQDIHSVDGSYWHGIMHRREPDYSNGKYWFGRVGEHPIFPSLCEGAKDIVSGYPLAQEARFLVSQFDWDPYAFIDLCQSIAQGRLSDAECDHEQLCRKIAQLEWRLLFTFCWERAVD